MYFDMVKLPVNTWGQDKMVNILRTTFSMHCLRWKFYLFKYHRSLFVAVQLTKCRYCFRSLGIGDKLLPDPMLTQIIDALWHHYTSMISISNWFDFDHPVIFFWFRQNFKPSQFAENSCDSSIVLRAHYRITWNHLQGPNGHTTRQ